MFFVDDVVHFSGGGITVAEGGGGGVGFVLWGPALQPAWFDPGVSKWAELHELHVHPDFQNRGLGFRLVPAAIRQARRAGFPVLYLMGDADHSPARPDVQ